MSQPTDDQMYKDRLGVLMDKAKPLAVALSSQLALGPLIITGSATGQLLTMAAELKAVITAISKLEMRYRSAKEILGQTNT